MERLLFRKIELWLVALIVLLMLLGAIFFAASAATEAASRHSFEMRAKHSRFSELAFAVASFPETLQRLLHREKPLAAGLYKRFGGRAGWHRYETKTPISGYLLLSRIDGDSLTAVSELIDLADFSVKHRWTADPESLFAGAGRTAPLTDYSQWSRERFRPMHPLMLADGSLVLHGQTTPQVKIDQCSRRVWMQQDTHYHHALNLDAEGNFWAPAQIEPSAVSEEPTFKDDGLAEVSPEGKLLRLLSMAEILDRHGLTYLVFQSNNFQQDPLHLNDIQPVLTDGPYWKKDDLFISLRNRSLVLLYRPSADAIIWMKQGPWLGQHDVDIIDDHTIAVFNNNVRNTGGGSFVDGNSDLRFYDFATGKVSSPYAAAVAKADLQAETNGLFDFTDSGHLIVEEDTSGRLLIFAPDHQLAADFINIAKDGVAYRMGWSRYVDRATGDAALAAMAAEPPCP